MKKSLIGSCMCIVLISIFSLGCAAKKGFDRGAIGENLYSAPEITEDEIKRILELKPQIKFPFKLGVYFSESYGGWYRWYGSNYRKWGKNEQETTWLDQLKTEGIISDVVPISSVTVTGHDDKKGFLKTIRFAAARHGVDAVLIVDYNCGVDRYNNYSAVLYLTILGGYLVPGTHSDALVIMKGALWDVRNEYLYLTVDAEGEAKKIGPAFILKDKDSVDLAKEKALKDFKEEVLARMRNLKGKSP